MISILESIKAKEGFLCSGSVTSDAVAGAEKELGVAFTAEFTEYVSRLGNASFVGHELAGINSSQRVNVVAATLRCREENASVPGDWYVVEETNMDGIVIWQSASGPIYMTRPNVGPKLIANSLTEYIVNL